jgi:hypothetical protein
VQLRFATGPVGIRRSNTQVSRVHRMLGKAEAPYAIGALHSGASDRSHNPWVVGSSPTAPQISCIPSAEQRYEAVRAVIADSETVTDVAARFAGGA